MRTNQIQTTPATTATQEPTALKHGRDATLSPMQETYGRMRWFIEHGLHNTFLGRSALIDLGNQIMQPQAQPQARQPRMLVVYRDRPAVPAVPAIAVPAPLPQAAPVVLHALTTFVVPARRAGMVNRRRRNPLRQCAMIIASLCVLVLLCALLGGCVSTGPQYGPPQPYAPATRYGEVPPQQSFWR